MVRRGFLVLLLVLAGVGCKKSDTTTDTVTEADGDALPFVMEASVQEAAGNASSVDGSSVQLLNINPSAACAYSSRSCDGTNLATINWNGCTLATGNGSSSITLSGIISESYSGSGDTTCTLTGSSSAVARTISAANPRVVTFASGATLTTDNVPGTAWDGTTFPTANTGTQIARVETGTVNGSACNAGTPCYNVEMRGLHRTLRGPRGRKWYEHIITSNVSTRGPRGGRTMTGTVTLWHQLLERKAVTTLTNVNWADANCCYPTSGSVSTVFTGSISATHTLTFSTTCGEASWNDGTSSAPYTLTQCTP